MMPVVNPVYQSALADLVGIYRSGGWSPQLSHLKSWADAGSAPLGKALDSIARELAADFALGIFSWDFCSATINRLHGLRFDLLDSDPGIFCRDFDCVYEAFDASEWVAPEQRYQKALEGISDFLTSVGIVITR